MKLTLADNWRSLHRKGTVIAGAIFTAIMGTGPLLVQAWSAMPSELKAVIPQNVQQWIAYTMFGMTFLALRYTSLQRTPKDDANKVQP